jgi:hypothetical protein
LGNPEMGLALAEFTLANLSSQVAPDCKRFASTVMIKINVRKKSTTDVASFDEKILCRCV